MRVDVENLAVANPRKYDRFVEKSYQDAKQAMSVWDTSPLNDRPRRSRLGARLLMAALVAAAFLISTSAAGFS